MSFNTAPSNSKFQIFIIVFVICFHSLSIFSQDTLSLKDQKPFDKSFILKFPSESKLLAKSASLFEVNSKGCFKTPKNCFRINKIWPFSKNNKIVQNSNKNDVVAAELDVVKQDTSGNVYISIPPLLPNKEYFLILNYPIDYSSMDPVYDLFDAGQLETAETLFNTISNSNLRVFKTRFDTECKCTMQDTFAISPFKDQLNFYRQKLQETHRQISAKKHLVDSLKQNFQLCSNRPSPIDSSFIIQLVIQSQLCVSCKDTLWEFQWLKRANYNYSDLLFSTLTIDSLFLLGFKRFEDLTSPSSINMNSISLEKRVENLNNSIQSLKILTLISSYLHLKYSIPFHDTNIHRIDSLISCLDRNHAQLSLLSTRIKKINEEIKQLSIRLVKIFESYDGVWLPAYGTLTNTQTYSFETRNGWVIKPDFGFMVYGNLGKSSTISGVSPYLGFHVNFRPLNSEIPFSTIHNKGILGHLSFNGGALVISFYEENKRQGLIGNTAIFTGLGWAFNHAIRINSGAVWYNKLNPNPLIKSKTVAATPYLGLSIDLRLRDIYDAFTKIFN